MALLFLPLMIIMRREEDYKQEVDQEQEKKVVDHEPEKEVLYYKT